MEVSFHEGEFKSLKNDTRFSYCFMIYHPVSESSPTQKNQPTSKKSTGLEGEFEAQRCQADLSLKK